jgi:hypothetical protein
VDWWIDAIAKVGFPIVAAGFLGWRIDARMQEMTRLLTILVERTGGDGDRRQGERRQNDRRITRFRVRPATEGE